ncbi:MAG: N-Dimethylarginine dimethylaminohydrolase [Chthonomonadaceae bacterium]|nr:N-Dimethylarginine dimethylaminohydrolase [Chthonomonadaceae bacterium]
MDTSLWAPLFPLPRDRQGSRLRAPSHPEPEGETAEVRPEVSGSTRLLMCPPTAYGLKYEINPWMSLQKVPDTELARCQWEALYRMLTEEMGAEVALIPQAANAPDMVFTANAGLVRGETCLVSRFRHPERQVEEPFFADWFAANGYAVQRLPDDMAFEGEGDALFAGDTLLAGYLKRSDIRAHRLLSDTFDVPVLSLELVDDRWYHLDTCLFPLDAETVVFYPDAFDSYAQTVLRDSFHTIEVTRDEALRFACNAVRVGSQIVLPSGCPHLTHTLEARGYTVHSVDLSEFLKAGGAAKCLTLYL